MDIPGDDPFLIHCESRNESLLDCPDEGRRSCEVLGCEEWGELFYGKFPRIPWSHTIHGTGIFTYIWLIFMVNVGEIYQSHGSYGCWIPSGVCYRWVCHTKCPVFKTGVRWWGVCQPHQLTSKTPSTSRLSLFPRYMSEIVWGKQAISTPDSHGQGVLTWICSSSLVRNKVVINDDKHQKETPSGWKKSFQTPHSLAT